MNLYGFSARLCWEKYGSRTPVRGCVNGLWCFAITRVRRTILFFYDELFTEKNFRLSVFQQAVEPRGALKSVVLVEFECR